MSDSISRQAAIDAKMPAVIDGQAIDVVPVSVIKRLPSAQKKGHWIDEGTNYLCSECHRGCWVNSDYCPWCGTDMRDGKDERH